MLDNFKPYLYYTITKLISRSKRRQLEARTLANWIRHSPLSKITAIQYNPQLDNDSCWANFSVDFQTEEAAAIANIMCILDDSITRYVIDAFEDEGATLAVLIGTGITANLQLTNLKYSKKTKQIKGTALICVGERYDQKYKA